MKVENTHYLYTGKGTLINSGKYNGLTTEKAKKKLLQQI